MDGIPNSEFRTQNSSNWVGNIDELDIEPVAFGDPSTEGADAESLGRVMARGHVMDTVLGRLMHDPLGGLSGHVGIESGGHRLMKLALGAAGHDADRRHQPIAAGEDLGFAIARLGDGGEELVRFNCLRKDPAHSCRSTAVHSESLELLESETTSQLGGVAEFEMSVQREVVADQRNPVFDQKTDPFSERADNARCFRAIP